MAHHAMGDSGLNATGRGDAVPDAQLSSGTTRQGEFYVVGIGASAGGLEALESMFRAVKEDAAMAFVVVQHLSPDFKSLMDELLARHTSMPIYRVQDGMSIRPNAVYLIPPNVDMTISAGRLLLTERDRTQSPHLPIDHFFSSLAQDAGPQSSAVVLSGTGSDGSRGIRDIHRAGGLVIAQSEESAKFDGMPRSAMATGLVDITETPERIPAILTAYVADSSRPLSELASDRSVNESRMETILYLLRKRHKVDFNQYKPTTIGRRIERRAQLNHYGDLEEYTRSVQADPSQLDQLYYDLLIGVTSFFRDPEAFESLRRNTLLPMLSQIPASEEFRVWVAACATGEEAYSIAILIDECLAKLKRQLNVKIFATDVHQASLEFAHTGVYAKSSLDQISEQRRSAYFDETEAGYRVSPLIRDMIVFAPHNVINDSPFTRLNLVTCRNFLIYLRGAAQKTVVTRFHFGLNSGGVLFMGASERPGELADEFDAVDERWRLFRKRRDVTLAVPPHLGTARPAEAPREMSPQPSIRPIGVPGRELIAVYDELLARKMPAALLVNQQQQVVHVFGGAGKYISVLDGRLSCQLFDIVCGDLKVALTGALQRAALTRDAVSYSRVRIKSEGVEQAIRLDVSLLGNEGSGVFYLISFEELDLNDSVDRIPESINLDGEARQQMDLLKRELRSTKANLQAAVEELESSNEELQATNEELVASNEELQGTNEELHSVNSEFQKKIRELTELNTDIDNLLKSTQVHTLFLDKRLCIRKFTPQMAPVFNLLPRDIGRPIDGFTHRLFCEDLSEKLLSVVNDGATYEEEVRGADGADHLMRILPYLAQGQIEGVVLTLVEMSKLKQIQREVDAERTRYEDSLSDQVSGRDRFLAMLSHELRNPMAAILNTIDATDKEDGQLDDSMQIIQRQSRHMARLLDDLLDVARIQQNRIEFRKQPVDLIVMSDRVLQGLHHRFEAKDQMLHVINGQRPLTVYGDPARLIQAQSNLLTNASKYTPPGGDIWYEIVQQDDQAVITVRDSGHGIPNDLRSKVFELFVQSDSTLDRSDGGMGVGLSLAQGIVTAHDGQISVESDGVGKGSTFCIRLPLTRKPLVSHAQQQPLSFDGRKLLLVEDNDDARAMLTKMLQLSGFEVLDAGDGPSALQLFSTFAPEIALVDIGLPGVDGYQVAREIRKLPDVGACMLVALTGYGRPEDQQAAIDAGFDLHLVKPLNPEELYHHISARFLMQEVRDG